MKKRDFSFATLLLCGLALTHVSAQTASTSDNLVAQPIPDRTVPFSVLAPGVSTPIIWGLDTAWPSEENIRRGVAFMGADRVDIVRASFQPTLPLIDGDLQEDQIHWINFRLGLVDLTGPDTKVVLNSDHPSVDNWYVGNATHWAQLIDATTRRVQERGRTVVSVAPFNEPDYSYTGQGTITDFYNIAGELKNNSRFDDIRISGGNTLNCDQATPWYNTLKERLDEGNTHQLAGEFDNYASFFETVRANGHHATNDELHNVMEAMVGVEYGMQTGIWWGTAELARGEFVKASDGERLGYAEHRPNWTAASVYRGPEGKVQAFGGTSERQAATTTYRFLSKDKDVYYDGHGPQREYTMVMPGGTGYQIGQTNAERVVNITWGDDIQPVIDGTYVLVNRNSGKVMEVAGGSKEAGTNVRQGNYRSAATFQRWNVIPVDSRVGGDFSYFTCTAVHSGMALDLLNYSLNDGGNIIVWNDGKSGNQQWYLEYAEDGWFYIRNRHSAKCLEVLNASTTVSANIQQGEKQEDGAHQQWRFLPVGVALDFNAPQAPVNLVATGNAASVQLDWAANTDTDLAGYTLLRSELAGGSFQTIARDVKSTSFVDNTVAPGKAYYYAVQAVDNCLNRSAYSNEVSATVTATPTLVARYQFEESPLDNSMNLNHSAPYGDVSYVAGKVGDQAVALDGKDAFLQLPSTVANQQEITIATWVYWKGGTAWQRVFDFGNGEDENMFLTPRSDGGQLRFVVKNGGEEQRLNMTASLLLIRNKWMHVAVTLKGSEARLYFNGELVDESDAFTTQPIDFTPVLNYIGRSQYASDPLFNGNIDDFRIYNYALSGEEIMKLAENELEGIAEVEPDAKEELSLWPLPANEVLNVSYSAAQNAGVPALSVYDLNGRLVMSKEAKFANDTQLNVSALPAGMYMLKVTHGEKAWTKEFIISR